MPFGVFSAGGKLKKKCCENSALRLCQQQCNMAIVCSIAEGDVISRKTMRWVIAALVMRAQSDRELPVLPMHLTHERTYVRMYCGQTTKNEHERTNNTAQLNWIIYHEKKMAMNTEQSITKNIISVETKTEGRISLSNPFEKPNQPKIVK